MIASSEAPLFAHARVCVSNLADRRALSTSVCMCVLLLHTYCCSMAHVFFSICMPHRLQPDHPCDAWHRELNTTWEPSLCLQTVVPSVTRIQKVLSRFLATRRLTGCLASTWLHRCVFLKRNCVRALPTRTGLFCSAEYLIYPVPRNARCASTCCTHTHIVSITCAINKEHAK